MLNSGRFLMKSSPSMLEVDALICAVACVLLFRDVYVFSNSFYIDSIDRTCCDHQRKSRMQVIYTDFKYDVCSVIFVRVSRIQPSRTRIRSLGTIDLTVSSRLTGQCRLVQIKNALHLAVYIVGIENVKI